MLMNSDTNLFDLQAMLKFMVRLRLRIRVGIRGRCS